MSWPHMATVCVSVSCLLHNLRRVPKDGHGSGDREIVHDEHERDVVDVDGVMTEEFAVRGGCA